MDPLHTTSPISIWAVIAVDGQRLAARLTQTDLFGAPFVRADVLNDTGCEAFTRFYNPAELRSVTPVDEPTARQLAKQLDVRDVPIRVYVIGNHPEGNPILSLPAVSNTLPRVGGDQEGVSEGAPAPSEYSVSSVMKPVSCPTRRVAQLSDREGEAIIQAARKNGLRIEEDVPTNGHASVPSVPSASSVLQTPSHRERILPPGTIAAMKRLADEGKANVEIAHELHLGRSTVSRYLAAYRKEAGIPSRRGFRRHPNATED